MLPIRECSQNKFKALLQSCIHSATIIADFCTKGDIGKQILVLVYLKRQKINSMRNAHLQAQLVFNSFSHSSRNGVMSLNLIRLRTKGYALESFSERRKWIFNCSLAHFELSSSHFNRKEMSSLIHFPVIVEFLATLPTEPSVIRRERKDYAEVVLSLN